SLSKGTQSESKTVSLGVPNTDRLRFASMLNSNSWSTTYFLRALVVGILLACSIASPALTLEGGVVFYVSPGGNDAWSGKLAETNKDKTDGPFATIGKARDAIRSLKAQGPLTQPVTVFIHGGLYVLAESVVFTPEDSGTKECPITYAAYPGETPVLSGGRKITGWKKLTEEVGDISPEARGKLWVAEVPKDWRFHQLFIDGKRMPRSATPNGTDWEKWPRTTGGGGGTALNVPPVTVKQWSNPED